MRKIISCMKLFNYKFLIISLLVSLIVNYRWLSFDIFTYSDYGFSFSETLKGVLGFGVWNSFSLGYVNEIAWRLLGLENIVFSFFGYLGFDSNIGDKFLLFWPWIFFSVIASYYLVKRITNSDVASMVGSFVFCFNSYFLSINRSGHFLISFSSVFAVFSIIFFIEFFQRRRIRDLFLTSIFLFLSSIIDLRFAYVAVWVLFFYVLYYIFFVCNGNNFRVRIFKNLFFSAIPIIILLFLNIFWILPYLNTGSLQGNTLNRSLFGNDFFNILASITLFHPFWSGGKIDWFVVQSIPFYFWLIPIFAFCGFIFNRKNKTIVFFAIISLLGVFLSKQVGYPFQGVYSWLFENLPGFNAFREASKFYFLIIIGYSVLIGSFISYLYQMKSKCFLFHIFRFFLLFLISFVFIWNAKPIITGEIGATYISRTIPNDYIIFKEFINGQSNVTCNYFRTLWVPGKSNWSFYSFNYPRIILSYVMGADWQGYASLFNDYNNLSVNSKLMKIFEFNIGKAVLNVSSIKYIIVPINDFKNDSDPFRYYGRNREENIREWYVLELDKVGWLKKIDIGTKDLVVYENEDYKSYIRGVTSVYGFKDMNRLEQRYSFLTSCFGKEFDFVVDDKNKNGKNVTYLYDVFSILDTKTIKTGQSSVFDNASIYNQNNYQIFYSREKSKRVFYKRDLREIVLYLKPEGDLSINESGLDILKDQEEILIRQKVGAGSKYFLKITERKEVQKSDGKNLKKANALPEDPFIRRIISLDGLKDESIGSLKEGAVLELFSIGENAMDNPSFEEGTWTEKVGDCHNYDKNPAISMSLDQSERTLGRYSLRLSAIKHIACTNQKFEITPGKYIIGFDYQSPNAKRAGSYLKLNDVNQTIIKNNLVIGDTDWHSYYEELDVPDGTTSAQMHIYAYESDKKINNIVRYDNFIFSKLNLEKRITIEEPKEEYKKIELSLSEGENVFEYKEEGHSYDNQFPNGSFEEGSWQEKVGDCHNYDDNRILAMSLNKEKKTDGEQSLQLEAARHIACVSRGIPIEGGRSYILKFDYQSDDSKTAGYYVAFDNPEKTKFSEKIKIEGTDWKTFEKNIKVPEGSKKMTIFIYAYPTDNVTNNIVRYDNFQLIQLPDLEDRFYLVSEPKEKLVEPKETNFDLINPTKKLVHIKGATTPFFLAMSESYHPQWELQMNNEKIQGLLDSWWPFAKREKVGEEYHYKLANFLNAWYVDVPELCKDDNKACTKNEDGSYDMELVVEFWPQRWFYLGLLISGTTLVGCIGYLGYDFVRSRRRKKMIKKQEKVL